MTVHKKIFRPLFWISVALVAVLGVTAVSVTAPLSFRQFRTLACENLRRETDYLTAKLDAVFERVRSLGADTEIVQALDEGRPMPNDTISLLDGGRIMTGGLACYLYSNDMLKACSSNVFRPVEFERLAKETTLAAFFADRDADTFLSVRNTALSGSFASSLYNPQEGVVSCYVRIRRDGRPVGYAVADLPPSFIYQCFTSKTYILLGETALLRDGGETALVSYRNNATAELSPSADRKYLVGQADLGGGASVQHCVSMSDYNRSFAVSVSVIAAAVLVGCATAYIVSKLLADWIYGSLNKIKQKIDGTLDA